MHENNANNNNKKKNNNTMNTNITTHNVILYCKFLSGGCNLFCYAVVTTAAWIMTPPSSSFTKHMNERLILEIINICA